MELAKMGVTGVPVVLGFHQPQEKGIKGTGKDGDVQQQHDDGGGDDDEGVSFLVISPVAEPLSEFLQSTLAGEEELELVDKPSLRKRQRVGDDAEAQGTADAGAGGGAGAGGCDAEELPIVAKSAGCEFDTARRPATPKTIEVCTQIVSQVELILQLVLVIIIIIKIFRDHCL